METYRYALVFAAVLLLLYTVETTAQEGNTQVMACMQKLLPCQQYLHVANPKPSPSCCGPMKEIVEKDAPCLCTVFNNPEMLKALNLTKENALDLPKACGAKPDISLCTKTVSSSPIASPVSTNGCSSVPAPASFIGLVSSFVAIIFF